MDGRGRIDCVALRSSCAAGEQRTQEVCHQRGVMGLETRTQLFDASFLRSECDSLKKWGFNKWRVNVATEREQSSFRAVGLTRLIGGPRVRVYRSAAQVRDLLVRNGRQDRNAKHMYLQHDAERGHDAGMHGDLPTKPERDGFDTFNSFIVAGKPLLTFAVASHGRGHSRMSSTTLDRLSVLIAMAKVVRWCHSECLLLIEKQVPRTNRPDKPPHPLELADGRSRNRRAWRPTSSLFRHHTPSPHKPTTLPFPSPTGKNFCMARRADVRRRGGLPRPTIPRKAMPPQLPVTLQPSPLFAFPFHPSLCSSR